MVDYTKLKEEYVTGSMSVKDLAHKYGCSVDGLRDHAKTYDWVKDRKKCQNSVLKKVMKRHEIDVLNELAILNGQDIALTKRMRQVLAAKLSEIEKCKDISLQDLALMARLHKDLQHVGRIALDANSDAVRTELVNQNKDKRDYTEDELKRQLAMLEDEEDE